MHVVQGLLDDGSYIFSLAGSAARHSRELIESREALSAASGAAGFSYARGTPDAIRRAEHHLTDRVDGNAGLVKLFTQLPNLRCEIDKVAGVGTLRTQFNRNSIRDPDEVFPARDC